MCFCLIFCFWCTLCVVCSFFFGDGLVKNIESPFLCVFFSFFFYRYQKTNKKGGRKKKSGESSTTIMDTRKGRGSHARKKEKKSWKRQSKKKKVVPLHMSVALRFRVSLGTTMPPVDPGGGGGMREAAPREGDLADSPPSGAILGMPEVPSF